jgi:hypothetical protein
MEVQFNRPTQAEDRRMRRILVGGIALWFLHQNAIYSLSSVSCNWGWFPFRIGALTGLQIVETLITLAALALMLVLIVLPYRAWRRFQSERPADNPHLLQDTEKDRRPMQAFIIMMLNSFLGLFILAAFVPIYALKVCSQV